MPAGSFVQTLKRCHQIKCVVCKVCLLDLISDKVGKGQRGENDLHVLGAESATNRQTDMAQKSTLLPLCLGFFRPLANKIRDSTSRAVISEVVSLYQLHPVSFFQRAQKNSSPQRFTRKRSQHYMCVFGMCFLQNSLVVCWAPS